jgi:hypothetical protein
VVQLLCFNLCPFLHLIVKQSLNLIEQMELFMEIKVPVIGDICRQGREKILFDIILIRGDRGMMMANSIESNLPVHVNMCL